MKRTCAMCTQTAILNTSSALAWISSLIVLIRDVNSKLFQAEGWVFRSWMIVVNMFANTSDHPCKQCGGEGCHRQRPWQEAQSVYFKFIVASDAVNTFILFNATSSLELVEWRWHVRMQEISVVKIFRCSSTFSTIFLTHKFMTWKFVTQIFSNLQ